MSELDHTGFLEEILRGTRRRAVGCFAFPQDSEVIALGFDAVPALERIIETRVDDAKYVENKAFPGLPEGNHKLHSYGETDLLAAYLVLTGRSDPARGLAFLRKRAAWLRADALRCIARIYGPWHFNKANFRLPVSAEVLDFARVSLESRDAEEADVAAWVLDGWQTGTHPGWQEAEGRLSTTELGQAWGEPDSELEALLEDILRAQKRQVRGFTSGGFDSEIVQLGPVTVPILEDLLANQVDGAKETWSGAGNILAAYLALTSSSDPRRCIEFLKRRGTPFRLWAIGHAQNVFGPWLYLKPDYAFPPTAEFIAFARECSESADLGEALQAKRLVHLWTHP